MSLNISHLIQLTADAFKANTLTEATGENRRELIQRICTIDKDYCIDWTMPKSEIEGQEFKIIDDTNDEDISIRFNEQRFQIERDSGTRIYDFLDGVLVVYEFKIPTTSSGYSSDVFHHEHHTKFLFVADRKNGSRKFYYFITHTHDQLNIYSGTDEQKEISVKNFLGMVGHSSDSGSGRD